MLVASWNVNSLRVRLEQVLRWVDEHKPDVLGLQETKAPNDVFPRAELESAGYHVIYNGQKTYNGVALLSRGHAHDIVTDLSSLEDPQRRLIGATIDNVRIYNVYVPNGPVGRQRQVPLQARVANSIKEATVSGDERTQEATGFW